METRIKSMNAFNIYGIYIYKVNLFSSILLIQDKYDELIMAHFSDDDGVVLSEPAVDSMALWVEASCGIKRGKIFGMGSLLRMYITKAASTSSTNATIEKDTN